MPELPEVEVTRLSFASQIAGARVIDLVLGKPLRWPLGCAPEQLKGSTVLGVRRRGKYLLLDLSCGVLLLHLGMSGSLAFNSKASAAGKHDHFDLVTDRGVLRLHDPRRFGAVVFALSERDPAAHKLLGRLGPEPLGDAFDLGVFQQALKAKRSPIKPVLLAGQAVVGVGNIYASEVLFLSGIRPTTRADTLSKPRVARLHAAIMLVLARAIATGGSTLKDFQNAQGETGHFQLEAMVYDRAGQSCKCAPRQFKAFDRDRDRLFTVRFAKNAEKGCREFSRQPCDFVNVQRHSYGRFPRAMLY
jgi:formamidopyrimidine-DNA glycosylase